MAYFRVPLAQTDIFEEIPGYLANDKEREQFKTQQAESSKPSEPKEPEEGPCLEIGFYPSIPRNIVPILKSCITRPNKQDLFYVGTKSLGLNMAIKITFATVNVLNGSLPFVRAICSTVWYQSQDVFFTLFGQTYMKFLGKMSRMLRVGRGYYGDLLFCFVQFSCFEILNRTILGPLGENPLAYTWAGIALILSNNLRGMISGGPTTPAIIRARRSGAISHKTMMHIYQLCGLTFHFGTFASLRLSDDLQDTDRDPDDLLLGCLLHLLGLLQGSAVLECRVGGDRRAPERAGEALLWYGLGCRPGSGSCRHGGLTRESGCSSVGPWASRLSASSS